MELEELIRFSRGEEEADLLLANCRLIDTLSGKVRPTSVAVSGGLVVGVGDDYRARDVLDLGGKYLAPGFIDAHVHMESSMISVEEFARTVVPRGTTAVVTDGHEIANVMGMDGIRYLVESSRGVPLDVFFMLPSCVPATPLETSGAVLEAADLESMLGDPSVKGLGELMNFPGTINRDPAVMAKLELFKGLPVDGHAPGLRGEDLSAYIAAGPDSDHECTAAAEAEEKLQKGMFIFIREGTGARNLGDLIQIVGSDNSRRFCLCIDDRHPTDLLERGHIDSMIKMALEKGIQPVAAFQMATMNTAGRFRLWGRGAVAVGYRADLVVLEDLGEMSVAMVFKDGRVVAEGGELLPEAAVRPQVPPSTFNVENFSEERLRIKAGGVKARVIGLVPGQIVTESLSVEIPVVSGEAVCDPASDVLKVAVVERHRGTGNVGLGFVRGFGLERGALASSVGHDSHNIVVVGASDPEMAAAVEEVVAMRGGQVVVCRGEVRASLALPIAGLMSPGTTGEVAARVRGLNQAAKALGCKVPDPFMSMSFLALPVIPELKLTDRGLVDVGRFEIVPLFE